VIRRAAPVFFLTIFICACTSRESRRDASLSSEIDQIPAIDNHAHPMIPGGQDRDYDALPVENLEDAPMPVRLRSGYFSLVDAHRALGQDRDDMKKVLARAGIQIMIANRVSMSPALDPEHFRWVAYADALMYPLDNSAMKENSDRKAFFELEEKLLARYYKESGVEKKPATLDDYLAKIVTATLERHKQGGAIGEKFEMAYLRSLAVGSPSKADASSAWSGKGDYRMLQDYILRYIASECGRLGMAVHFHTGEGGGGYFDVAGSNPILLEPLFDDPSLRKTKFVLLHGGWPFSTQAAGLLTKPNVWIDFSSQPLVLSRDEVSRNIRTWLEFVPEKVLFGTDAYPYAPDIGWQETAVVGSRAGRAALSIALTSMMREGEIQEDRALELARMVLRDNARKLYGLP
jgi:hypothetical protein